jgi:hypothetical protein
MGATGCGHHAGRPTGPMAESEQENRAAREAALFLAFQALLMRKSPLFFHGRYSKARSKRILRSSLEHS